MRRHLIGVCSVLLLAAAGLAAWFGGEGAWAMVLAAGVRLGLILGLLWIAWPQVAELPQRLKPWLIGAGVVLVLLALLSSQWLLPILAPLALAMGAMWFWQWLMKPPPGHRTGKRSPSAAPRDAEDRRA